MAEHSTITMNLCCWISIIIHCTCGTNTIREWFCFIVQPLSPGKQHIVLGRSTLRGRLLKSKYFSKANNYSREKITCHSSKNTLRGRTLFEVEYYSRGKHYIFKENTIRGYSPFVGEYYNSSSRSSKQSTKKLLTISTHKHKTIYIISSVRIFGPLLKQT